MAIGIGTGRGSCRAESRACRISCSVGEAAGLEKVEASQTWSLGLLEAGLGLGVHGERGGDLVGEREGLGVASKGSGNGVNREAWRRWGWDRGLAVRRPDRCAEPSGLREGRPPGAERMDWHLAPLEMGVVGGW